MRFLFILFALTLGACAEKQGPECLEPLRPDPNKNSILVVGDSISVGYTPFLAQSLGQQYEILHNPCNAQTSRKTVLHIQDWLRKKPYWHAVTFNNGLWDLSSFAHINKIEYADNLKYIARFVKAKTNRPLFILTTHVPQFEPYRKNTDVETYNKIAIEVMQQEGVPVADLYTLSVQLAALGLHTDASTEADAHWTDAGSQALGEFIAQALISLGL